MKQSVKAVVTVLVEIVCDSSWSDDTTMAQIVSQAERDAKEQLENIFVAATTPDRLLRCSRPRLSNVRLVDVVEIQSHVVTSKE